MARLYFDLKDYDKAEKYFLECLNIDSEYHNVNWRYSFLLYNKGDIEKALKFIKIEMRINNITMYDAFNYGYYNHLLGNKTEADKGMRKALKLVETIEDKREILEFMEIKETDDKGLEYLNIFTKCLETKFK